MGRGFRRREPYAPKVEKIELSDKHVKARVIIAITLALVGAATIAFGVWQLTQKNKGWQFIETGLVKGYTHNDEFSFNYDCGAGKKSATKDYRAVSDVYNEALGRIYPLFDNYTLYDGVINLRWLNEHPNEEVTVDALLYQAFELIAGRKSRTMYLAPAYEAQRELISARSDAEAALIDPYTDKDAADYYAACAAYARDPAKVELRLLSDRKVVLFVSEDYLAFGREHGVSSYLDLWFIANAFIVDYCADKLTQKGYTHGYIESFDGFSRYLDDRGGIHSYLLSNLSFDKDYKPAAMEFNRPIAVADLRTYAKSSYEAYERFYRYADGRICSDYLDISDGRSRTGAREFFAYSYDRGCAETALGALEVFVADAIDSDRAFALSDRMIWAIYAEKAEIIHTEKDLTLKKTSTPD